MTSPVNPILFMVRAGVMVGGFLLGANKELIGYNTAVGLLCYSKEYMRAGGVYEIS